MGARRMPLSTGCSMAAGSWLSIWSRALPGEPVPCSLALDSGPRTRWTRSWSRRRSSSAAPSLRRGIRRTWGAFRQVFATCECLRFEIYGVFRATGAVAKPYDQARAARRATRAPWRLSLQHASASSTAHPIGTRPQPSRAPRFRDRLSHLSLDDAAKILGPDGRRLLTRGGALELAAPDDLRIDEHEARLQWEGGPAGLTSRLFLDPSVRGGLRAVCSACTKPCEHVGGLLSILLEQKTDLGLATPPPDATRATDEEDLVAQALEERAKRAKTERMTVRSVDPSTPWTDYTISNATSGKTYRVALRGDQRGVSYCSCPDFKINTLGTCKHVMKVLARTTAFPREVREKPYRRRRITVHLRYAAAVSVGDQVRVEGRAVHARTDAIPGFPPGTLAPFSNIFRMSSGCTVAR